MTAVDTAPAPAATPALRGTRPVPLGRLVDVELRKVRDTRAGAWLLAGVVTMVIGTVAAFVVWGTDERAGLASVMSALVMALQLLLPLVAALAVTTEWSQRGALTTFALVPHRRRVVGAKALAALLVTLAAVALSFAVAAAGVVTAGAVHDVPVAWDLSAEQVARAALLTVVAAAVGFALALLIRSSAPALVAYLGFMLVVPMLSGIAAGYLAWWAEHGPWLDLSWSLQVMASPEVTGEQWAQLATSTLLWVGVPLAVGLRGLLRTEIR